MLSSVPESDSIIIADLEAGIGTLTRLPEQSVDVTLVVVEPTPRSIDVARRAVLVAGERGQGRVVIVGNKVADTDDEQRLRTAFPDQSVVMVPADANITVADRQGVSPVDLDATSPAVVAVSSITELL